MKKYITAFLGLIASIGMAILFGKKTEQAKQAERDKKAQQKVTEVYRDSEAQFKKDVADGMRGDDYSHFEQ